MRKNKQGFTLVELLVVIVIIGVLAALLLPAISKAMHAAQVNSCINNLSQLWKMMYVYQGQFGGNMKIMPGDQFGKNFWLHMENITPPLIENRDLFSCPPRGIPVASGLCQFNGPTSNVNLLTTENYIGADDILEPHIVGEKTGNAIRKAGDCRTYVGDEWENKAFAGTQS